MMSSVTIAVDLAKNVFEIAVSPGRVMGAAGPPTHIQIPALAP